MKVYFMKDNMFYISNGNNRYSCGTSINIDDMTTEDLVLLRDKINFCLEIRGKNE